MCTTLASDKDRKVFDLAQRRLINLENRFKRKVNKRQRERKKTVLDFVTAAFRADSVTSILRIPRLGSTQDLIDEHVGECFLEGAIQGKKDIEAGEESPQTLNRGPLPDQAIEYIKKRRQYNRFYDEDQIDDLREAMVDIIEQGMSLEQSKGRLRRVFANFSGPRLENISQTESIAAFNYGRLAMFTGSNGFVKGVEFLAIVDTRTTQICIDRDGLRLPLDSPLVAQNTPPLHFRCRSMWSPITRIEMKRIVRDDPTADTEQQYWAKEVPKWSSVTDKMEGFAVESLPQPATDSQEPLPKATAPVRKKLPDRIRDIRARRGTGTDLADMPTLEEGLEIGGEIFETLVADKEISEIRIGIVDLQIELESVEDELNDLYDASSSNQERIEELRRARDRTKKELVRLKKEMPGKVLAKIKESTGKNIRFGKGKQRWTKFSQDDAIKTVETSMKVIPNEWLKASAKYDKMTTKEVFRGGYIHARKGLKRGSILEISGRNEAELQSTALHEMTHRLERLVPGLDQYAIQFLEMRTGDERLIKINEILPGFGFKDSEVTQEDDFADPYMGKHYGKTREDDGDLFIDGRSIGRTEVLTMSMESLFYNSYDNFWDNDPESIKFALGALSLF